MKLLLKRLVLTLALPLVAGAAFASGSDSFGGGLTGEQQSYNAGKAVYAQKIGCSKCMMAGKALDKTSAQNLLANPDKTTNLSDEERVALTTYLKLRFKL